MPDTATAEKPKTAGDLIRAALALAGGNPEEDLAGAVLPSARSAQAVRTLVEAGDPESLQASRPDMRQIMADMLNWNGPKATKATMKAAAKALLAKRDGDDAVCYPQAVEALSFASACAPLLEPDRLSRIIDAAIGTEAAYAPILYPATVTATLKRVIGHYSEDRIEKLLLDLWEVSHDGRWWDHTAGMGKPRKKRRKRGEGEDAPERGHAVGAQAAAINAVFEGGTPAQAVEALIEGNIAWNPPTQAQLQRARLKGKQYEQVAALAVGHHDDPDMAILCAQMIDLRPADRPANPIPVMVATLEVCLGDAVPAEFLPKKPGGWSELYPKDSLEAFPIPPFVLDMDWETLPGTGGAQPAVVELIRSPHALFENKEYMGNCTYTYKGRCASGSAVLGKVHFVGEVYNFALNANGGDWRLGEVNSRHNRGNVPQEVRDGITRLLEDVKRKH